MWWISICEIQDYTTSRLSEMCCDVGVEPLWHATANREDGTRLDVVARDFWGRNKWYALFDVRVLILLHAPIPVSHCQDATRYMNRRKDEHMMKEFRRWRELAFPL